MIYVVGSELECKLVGPGNSDCRRGLFSFKLDNGLKPFVGRETAAIFVYSATIAAWTYVAILPLANYFSTSPVGPQAGASKRGRELVSVAPLVSQWVPARAAMCAAEAS